EVLNLVNYDNNPQRIKNNIAIPSSYTKILKGDNFKECYQVPNHIDVNEDHSSFNSLIFLICISHCLYL
ncbi:hypothetical protein ACQQQT_001654, partial [Campylobacter jejuni]|nr:hypothetical protein [Campylobacter jejuni]EAH6781614.1 hypothetical protein [Campylobacter jejuni]EAH9496937.1 hypothetical protein [Campylobacter jejuni]EAH9838484.1 hypothetical protein [Campylobacter jejuni]EAI1161789.1 hypothetical protein [Campylobacter jejuni]